MNLPHYTDQDPAPYETIVMELDDTEYGDEDLEQFRDRYDSEARAREGHQATVEAVAAWLGGAQHDSRTG